MGRLAGSRRTDPNGQAPILAQPREGGVLVFGWILSPAFDLNPDPDGTGLSLNISETDNALSFDLALEVAPFFRLSPETAAGILQHVREVMNIWRSLARHLGIRSAEQDLMASAFEV